MLHKKFREFGLLVLKKIFEGVFSIYGRGGHLGHVTSILIINFNFHVSISLHKKLVKTGPLVSDKSKF